MKQGEATCNIFWQFVSPNSTLGCPFVATLVGIQERGPAYDGPAARAHGLRAELPAPAQGPAGVGEGRGGVSGLRQGWSKMVGVFIVPCELYVCVVF